MATSRSCSTKIRSLSDTSSVAWLGHVEHVNGKVLVTQRVRNLQQLLFQLGGGDPVGLVASYGVKVRDRSLVPPTSQPIDQRCTALQLDALPHRTLKGGLHGDGARGAIDDVHALQEGLARR